MKKVVRLAEHALFALNVLIVFLFVFENRIVLPSWIQVIGRMHPLFLHFPIAIVLLVVVFYFMRPWLKTTVDHEGLKAMLLLSAWATSLTILMGLFLSREPGYSGEVLFWHKWLGVAVGFLMSGCYYYERAGFPTLGFKISSVVLVVLLVFTGHFGAELTHGEDFLFAPVRLAKSVEQVPLEEALIYDHIIRPIVEEKCGTCHNESKAKGKLVLTTKEGIAKGGKDGKLFEIDTPGEGIFLQRIHLPEDDKKHMPPKSKAQLTDEELQLLEQWIHSGSELEKHVMALPPDDTLRVLIENYFGSEEEVYDFAYADVETIEKLNSAYRVIYPLATNSPALSVTFYNAPLFNIKQMEELAPLQKQIVSLDLNKMPIEDQDLKIISSFENLRRLNLNFSNITGATLSSLGSLKHLTSLSVSSSKITDEGITQLAVLKNLKSLYCWNTAVSEGALEQLKEKIPGLKIETGFVLDHTKVLKLTSPRIVNDSKIYKTDFKLTITHPITGVAIRYTLDGTEPDSLHGELYTHEVTASAPVTSIQAVAFKEGWYGSTISSAYFFKSVYKPDSIWFITLPDRKYFANGAKTLIDQEAGSMSYGSYEGWLGFRENKMETEMMFSKPVMLSSVTLSTRYDHGAFLFPPTVIKVWGGTDSSKMKLLSTVSPVQPVAYGAKTQAGIVCIFPQQEIRFIKIIAEPVAKLPAWHKKKGEKGWFFVDEILLN